MNATETGLARGREKNNEIVAAVLMVMAGELVGNELGNRQGWT